MLLFGKIMHLFTVSLIYCKFEIKFLHILKNLVPLIMNFLRDNLLRFVILQKN